VRSRLGVLLDALLQPGALRKVREYLEDVSAGEDMIEAMHGHLCSPGCWHYMGGTAETRARIDALVKTRKARGRT
jgi:hypothetical protein